MAADDMNSKTQAMYFQLFMLLMVVFTILYFFVVFCQGMKRKEVFNPEFMAQFDEVH